MTNDSLHVDETYVKVKKRWMYLYRAVDSQGNTLEFHLSPTKDAQAAKRFFSKALAAPHTSTPRVITVDKNPTYPKAYKELKAGGMLPDPCELRQRKYLNNLRDSSEQTSPPKSIPQKITLPIVYQFRALESKRR